MTHLTSNPPHVTIAFNAPVPRALGRDWAAHSEESSTPAPAAGMADIADESVRDAVRAVASVLRGEGYRVSLLEVTGVSQLCTFLDQEKPDAVFNCCEGLDGRADLEMHVAAVFELCGIPYTGSTPLALGLALDKAMTKTLLAAHDIPTPPAAVLRSVADLDRASHLGWPLIVKPLAEDASIGIDRHAVVHDIRALSDRVQWVTREFQGPALVEVFIDGREFAVPLLATDRDTWTALPIGEIVFGNLPAGHPRILTYEAKWSVESLSFAATMSTWPRLDDRLSERLRSMALGAARAIGIRDYGRVDIRMNDADGALHVLEVNPNPDLTPGSGFVAPDAERTTGAGGLSHADVVLQIVRRALERGQP